MGMIPSLLKLTIKLHNKRHFQGPALSLGCQDIYATYEELEAYFRQMGTPFKPVPNNELKYTTSEHFIKHLKQPDYVHEDVFFQMLGIDNHQSLDVSDRDGATIIHNLNAAVPADLQERFAFVLDSGTIEHIFDVAAVLKNIVHMTRLGGFAAHFTPASNYVNHGFYSFSPTLFYDFYSLNGFANFESYLLFIDKDDYLKPCSYLEYHHKNYNPIFLNSDKLVLFAFAAQKVKTVAEIAIPAQGMYLPASTTFATETGARSIIARLRDRLLRQLPSWLFKSSISFYKGDRRSVRLRSI